MTIDSIIKRIDDFVWGAPLLLLLIVTSIVLMFRLDSLPLKNLRKAFRMAFQPETKAKEAGRLSSFASLMTELAITLGIGNIVGVVSAMRIGGPGALFWMVVTSFFSLSTKLVESCLSVKYRTTNELGHFAGGPMYTCKRGIKPARLGRILGILFAFFALTASLGMGNMTQSNAISNAFYYACGMDKEKIGLMVSVCTILVVLGGIKWIGNVTKYLIPIVGGLYLLATLVIIVINYRNLPEALSLILFSAFKPKAFSGGIFGTITVSAFQSLRWGVSRGVFSHEAGLGAAGITAATADTEDYIKQGYISMTSVFLDTAVVCTCTGLAFVCSGIMQKHGPASPHINDMDLTLSVFQSVFFRPGGTFIAICIALFAFATMIGWAYQGERVFEFLTGGKTKYNIIYRFIYGIIAFFGCVFPLETIWNMADICNGLMSLPNLICIWLLAPEICKEIKEYKA